MKLMVFLVLLDVVSSYQFKRSQGMFVNFVYLVNQLPSLASQPPLLTSVSVSTVSDALKVLFFLNKITLLTSNEQNDYLTDKVHWADRKSQSKVWNRFLELPKKDGSDSLFPKHNSFRKQYKPKIDSVTSDEHSESALSKNNQMADKVFSDIINFVMLASNSNLNLSTEQSIIETTPWADPLAVGVNVVMLATNSNLNLTTERSTSTIETTPWADPVAIEIKSKISREEDDSYSILKFISDAAVQADENGQVKKEKSDHQKTKNAIIPGQQNPTELPTNVEQEQYKNNFILQTLFEQHDLSNKLGSNNKKVKLSDKSNLNKEQLPKPMKIDHVLNNEPNLVKNRKTSLISNNGFLKETYNNTADVQNTNSTINNNKSDGNPNTNEALKYNLSQDLNNNRSQIPKASLTMELTMNSACNETDASTECVNLFNNTLYNMSEDLSNENDQKPQGSSNTSNSPEAAEMPFSSNNQSACNLNELNINRSENISGNVPQILNASSNRSNSPKAAELLVSPNDQSDNNTVEPLTFNIADDPSYNISQVFQGGSDYHNTNNTLTYNLSDNPSYSVSDILHGSTNTTNSPIAAEMPFYSNNQSGNNLNTNKSKYNMSEDVSNNKPYISQSCPNVSDSPKAAEKPFSSNNQSGNNLNTNKSKYNMSEGFSNNKPYISQGCPNVSDSPKAAEKPFTCNNQSNSKLNTNGTLKSSKNGQMEPLANSNKASQQNINTENTRITLMDDPTNRTSSMKSTIINVNTNPDSTDKLKVNASRLVNYVNNNEDEDTRLLNQVNDHNDLFQMLESIDPILPGQIGTKESNNKVYDDPEPVLKDLSREKVDDNMQGMLNNILGFKNADENIIWNANKGPYSIVNVPNDSSFDEDVGLRDSKNSPNCTNEYVTLFNNTSNDFSSNESQNSTNIINSPEASQTQSFSNNQSVGQQNISQLITGEKVSSNCNKMETNAEQINKDTIKIPMLKDYTDDDSSDQLKVNTNILVKDLSDSDKSGVNLLENVDDKNLLVQILESIDPILLGEVKHEDINKNANKEPEAVLKDLTKENDDSLKDVISNILGIKQPDIKMENKVDGDEDKPINKYDGKSISANFVIP